MKQIAPLRDEQQKRGKLAQAAGERHAPAQELCKLLKSFSESEQRLLTFISTKQTACGIPPELPRDMKKSHIRTEGIVRNVCNAAANGGAQAQAGPTLSDVVGGPSIPEDAPTKRKGGSTFDTLNGNVLAR